MSSATVYIAIRKTVQTCLPGARVLLFGSRARGDHDRLSDYDLLIITPTSLTPHQKILWSTKIDRAIVEHVHVPVDLILNSEDEISQKQEIQGHIIRSILRDGVIFMIQNLKLYIESWIDKASKSNNYFTPDRLKNLPV